MVYTSYSTCLSLVYLLLTIVYQELRHACETSGLSPTGNENASEWIRVPSENKSRSTVEQVRYFYCQASPEPYSTVDVLGGKKNTKYEQTWFSWVLLLPQVCTAVATGMVYCAGRILQLELRLPKTAPIMFLAWIPQVSSESESFCYLKKNNQIFLLSLSDGCIF